LGARRSIGRRRGSHFNYIAITGALSAIGRVGQPPSIPLNLVGDFGGGALYLALGILAALQEATRSGKGQIVDAAIVDGALSLMTMHYGNLAAGMWRPERGTNVIDSGAPFYNVYECSDGQWISIAAVEHRFFRELLSRIGIAEADIPDRLDRSNWPHAYALLAERFKTRPLCVQRRLARSVGDSPTGVKVGAP
jgi:alpha-methylacyl-CoA racemase